MRPQAHAIAPKEGQSHEPSATRAVAEIWLASVRYGNGSRVADLPGGGTSAISEPEDVATMEPAMSLDAPETEIVTAKRVACDGGEGAMGHPRVWLLIDPDTGFVECGYCDKKFVHEDYVGKSE